MIWNHLDFLMDLLDYGLVQYSARYKDDDVFLLYQDYRQYQALMKILENPKHNQLGTYYKDGNMYIFAGLKKDGHICTAVILTHFQSIVFVWPSLMDRSGVWLNKNLYLAKRDIFLTFVAK